MHWTLLGVLVTGGALAAACTSVEGNGGCGGVFLRVGATWALIGGLSAASLESSSKIQIKGPDWEVLRPYARYPQGLPQGLDLRGLIKRPLSGP